MKNIKSFSGKFNKLYGKFSFTTPEIKNKTKEEMQSIISKRKQSLTNQIFEEFGFQNDEAGKKNLQQFLKQYSTNEDLGKFIFNEDFQIDAKAQKMKMDEYQKPFQELNSKYEYFPEQDSQEHSSQFAKYVVASSAIHNKDLEDYKEEENTLNQGMCVYLSFINQ